MKTFIDHYLREIIVLYFVPSTENIPTITLFPNIYLDLRRVVVGFGVIKEKDYKKILFPPLSYVNSPGKKFTCVAIFSFVLLFIFVLYYTFIEFIRVDLGRIT